MDSDVTTAGSRRESVASDYRRARVAAGGVMAVLVGVTVLSPVLHPTKGDYVWLIGLVVVLWTPLVLITTRRAFLWVAIGLLLVPGLHLDAVPRRHADHHFGLENDHSGEASRLEHLRVRALTHATCRRADELLFARWWRHSQELSQPTR